ncbi:hypothetical protein GF378_03310 [Candidatus Pacearchaeota archaeon]|nr:hypothetical protein [Candidatus Pacearchaeota archaeon]
MSNMTRHLKRQKVPTNWPISRKGTKYVVRPRFGLEKGVPLLVFVRDMLKIAQNKKEVKRAIQLNNIIVNGVAAKDEKQCVQLFDKVSFIPSKKHFKLSISSTGKFKAEEIKEKQANQKVAKIINKTMLKGKKMQLNLSDGRNYISDIKCNVNDSVSIDFKKKKINKCLALEKGAKVVVVTGKHAGERGKVKEVDKKSKTALLNVDGSELNILIKQIMVTD